MSYVVSLLSSPKSPVLDTSLVENLGSAWAGAEAKWLSAGEAAEFSVNLRPDNFWEVWADLQTVGVDMVIQSASGRRKQMLIADMDSTMIEQECIDELAAEAGVGDQVAAVTARAMNGEIDFADALRARVKLMAGLSSSVIDTVLSDRISLMPGGSTMVATMKGHGAYAVLVSGGFVQFAEKIATQLGFDEFHANSFVIENGRLTGAVVPPILGQDAKVAQLVRISTVLGLREDQVMAVGDGANDLGMLGMAGAGVALHAKPVVAAQSEIRINHGDLTALLYIQGYRKSEFSV